MEVDISSSMGDLIRISNKVRKMEVKFKRTLRSLSFEEFSFLSPTQASTINCLVCNSSFQDTTKNVLFKMKSRAGYKCPLCFPKEVISQGFNVNLPATLYYIKIQYGAETFYKIGITNRTIRDRFTRVELDNITVLFTIDRVNGTEILAMENLIKSTYKIHRAFGKEALDEGISSYYKTMLQTGHSEVFVRDVFSGLINPDKWGKVEYDVTRLFGYMKLCREWDSMDKTSEVDVG